MNEYQSLIQNNIKKLIRDQGMKQKAVGLRAGFKEKEFSNMLNGRKTITAAHIPSIAKALGVSFNDIYQKEKKDSAAQNP